jgi:DNA-binding MarR family transcriptional regulator
LQRITGLNAGNLSVHLSKLEKAGLVKIEKFIVAKRTNTHVSITEEGRRVITGHWDKLEALRKDASAWKPDDE